jgi:hypothetical protein
MTHHIFKFLFAFLGLIFPGAEIVDGIDESIIVSSNLLISIRVSRCGTYCWFNLNGSTISTI